MTEILDAMPINVRGGWVAYELLPERGWKNSATYRYAGRWRTKEIAQRKAGRGGYVYYADLTLAQGEETGFPKSFHEFVK